MKAPAIRSPVAPRRPSSLEKKFSLFWKAIDGPALQQEVPFHPTRKWRFDFAHPATKVAIEVEGGIWTGGRHTRGAGYESDCEKYNAAATAGWAVFRLTGKQISVKRLEDIAGLIRIREMLDKEGME